MIDRVYLLGPPFLSPAFAAAWRSRCLWVMAQTLLAEDSDAVRRASTALPRGFDLHLAAQEMAQSSMPGVPLLDSQPVQPYGGSPGVEISPSQQHVPTSPSQKCNSAITSSSQCLGPNLSTAISSEPQLVQPRDSLVQTFGGNQGRNVVAARSGTGPIFGFRPPLQFSAGRQAIQSGLSGEAQLLARNWSGQAQMQFDRRGDVHTLAAATARWQGTDNRVAFPSNHHPPCSFPARSREIPFVPLASSYASHQKAGQPTRSANSRERLLLTRDQTTAITLQPRVIPSSAPPLPSIEVLLPIGHRAHTSLAPSAQFGDSLAPSRQPSQYHTPHYAVQPQPPVVLAATVRSPAYVRASLLRAASLQHAAQQGLPQQWKGEFRPRASAGTLLGVSSLVKLNGQPQSTPRVADLVAQIRQADLLRVQIHQSALQKYVVGEQGGRVAGIMQRGTVPGHCSSRRAPATVVQHSHTPQPSNHTLPMQFQLTLQAPSSALPAVHVLSSLWKAGSPDESALSRS
jgi:hypothetical protein